MGNSLSVLTNKTVVGWVLIAAIVGYGATRYLSEKNAKALKQTSQRVKVQGNQPKKENKAKKQRLESFAHEAKQAPKSYAAAAAATSSPSNQSKAKTTGYSSDDGADNRAFAAQMARNKQSKFTPKTTAEHKQKSVKQSKAKAISDDKEAGKVSAPSSTAGIDADDDQSSVASPSVSAADATGVADMLEQPAAGPSVLRLTGTEEKQQKPKQTKAVPQPTETKKQRQNRKKREQERAAREEEEKERKVKQEAQRRTARLAEGRAAQDGSAFMAAQKTSAWTGNATNGNSGSKAAEPAIQPLDTFDVPKATSAPVPAPTTNGKENKKNGAEVDWTVNVPEEEQMRRLRQQEDEESWVSVPKKGRKNKKASTGAATSETEESANEAAAPVATAPVTKTTSASTNGRPKLPNTQSSFAALGDEGAHLEDEEEEHEWDI